MSNIISAVRAFFRLNKKSGDFFHSVLRKTSLVLALCLLTGVFCGAGKVGEIAAAYVETPFYADGIRCGRVLSRADKHYIAAADFCAAVDAGLEAYESGSDRVDVLGDGFSLTAVAGERYFEVNGRCIWTETPIPSRSGRVLLPLAALCEVFSAECRESGKRFDVDTDGLTYIDSGESFYDADDLYWLSRLISSEAGGEPLDGKLAVGNVVLNRVSSSFFPDSIEGVVFDDAFGVQFSVVPAGTIYHEPNRESVAAAKLCLEGVNNIGDALYFVNPKIGAAGWFAKTRTFVTTINGHDFYA